MLLITARLMVLLLGCFSSYSFAGCLSESQQSKKSCQSQLAPFLKEKRAPKIFVFVSFSMPEASLKALAQEAEKYDAVLVMRGLYEDSFVKTALKLQEISIDINPELFEKHHITAVPTFIAIQNGEEIHRLSGNVSLSFCIQQFEGVR